MKIAIRINPTTAIRAGKNHSGLHLIEVDPAELTPAEREWLAAHGDLSWVGDPQRKAALERGADLCLAPPVNQNGTHADKLCNTFVEPTLDEIRRVIAESFRLQEQAKEEAEAREAKEREENLAKAQKYAAAPSETLVERSYAGGPWNVTRLAAYFAEKLGDEVPQLVAKVREASQIAEQREAARLAEIARVKAEEEEAKRRAEEEKAAWIAAHGSPRLRRLAEEEIEHEAVYRDERLAKERPDWRWIDQIPGEEKEARNAPLKAIELLDEARNVEPDATLSYWVVDHKHDEECCFYDDDQCPAYDWAGYVAKADFLGKWIVYGGPA